MPGLLALVKNIEDVPEPLRGLYVKPSEDAQYHLLQVEPVDGWSIDHTDGLKNALSGKGEEVRKLKTNLQAFDGIDPAKAREAMAQWEKVKAFNPEQEADKIATAKLESYKAQLQEATAKDLGAKDKRIGTLEGVVGKSTIGAQATAALAKHKGSVALLLSAVESQCRWRLDDGGNVIVEVMKDDNPRIRDAQGTLFTIDDLVLEMKAHPDFGRAFEASGASGSGSPPGGSSGGGQSGPIGAISSRKDFKSPREKADFIEKHGLDAFKKLPE